MLLTACAGGTKRSELDRNAADIAFARDMIAHHEQAVEMSDLVGADASAEVMALARQIEAAQGPEIDRMNGWLDDWDAEEMDDEMSHDTGHGSMPGMMSRADLEALEQASGETFDRSWLTMMIAHHEGAVEMARTEIADGKNAEAIALAEDIVSSQSDEITTMKELLR